MPALPSYELSSHSGASPNHLNSPNRPNPEQNGTAQYGTPRATHLLLGVKQLDTWLQCIRWRIYLVLFVLNLKPLARAWVLA